MAAKRRGTPQRIVRHPFAAVGANPVAADRSAGGCLRIVPAATQCPDAGHSGSAQVQEGMTECVPPLLLRMVSLAAVNEYCGPSTSVRRSSPGIGIVGACSFPKYRATSSPLKKTWGCRSFVRPLQFIARKARHEVEDAAGEAQPRRSRHRPRISSPTHARNYAGPSRLSRFSAPAFPASRSASPSLSEILAVPP